MFKLGYNTNGLAHHRVLDALDLVADIGYGGVALTPDAGLLDPYQLRPGELESVRARAADLGLALTLETGSRFLLDGRRKHFPTLLEAAPGDRARRVDFLQRCNQMGADLGASVVSFWAGAAADGVTGDAGGNEELWERLVAGTREVLAHGREVGVQVAFEPEPGMFIEGPAGFDELLRRLGADGEQLGLCLDVGHLLCTGDLPVGDVILRYGSRIKQVHLDDIKDGQHVHRMFGEGDLDLAETLSALQDINYQGMAAVELSRDAHRGPEAAREAFVHLQRALAAR
jgi:L-ribulose-5-phosphate 3-epimerase